MIKRYRLGLVPFFIAFADWAGQATNYRKRHAQHKKLELLYKAYYDDQPPLESMRSDAAAGAAAAAVAGAGAF